MQKKYSNSRMSPLDHVCKNIAIGDGCWEWQGFINSKGYGKVTLTLENRKRLTKGAHRLVWETLVGAVPKGMELDHLCRNPKCVRIDHLEPVTRSENMLRAWPHHQSQCRRGHALIEDNLVSHGKLNPTCKACTKLRRDAQKARSVQ